MLGLAKKPSPEKPAPSRLLLDFQRLISSAAVAPLPAHIRPLFLPDLVEQSLATIRSTPHRREQAHPAFTKWAKDLNLGVLQQLHETQVEQDFNHVLLRGWATRPKLRMASPELLRPKLRMVSPELLQHSFIHSRRLRMDQTMVTRTPTRSRPDAFQFGLGSLLLVPLASAVCFAAARSWGAAGVSAFVIVVFAVVSVSRGRLIPLVLLGGLRSGLRAADWARPRQWYLCPDLGSDSVKVPGMRPLEPGPVPASGIDRQRASVELLALLLRLVTGEQADPAVLKCLL